MVTIMVFQGQAVMDFKLQLAVQQLITQAVAVVVTETLEQLPLAV
jgi:hypothetical protein